MESQLPSIETIFAILVGASVFAYAVTWVAKPLIRWALKGKVKGVDKWLVRLVSVVVGTLIGVGLSAALGADWIWGLVFGAGGGAMTTIAVAIKKAASKRVAGDQEGEE